MKEINSLKILSDPLNDNKFYKLKNLFDTKLYLKLLKLNISITEKYKEKNCEQICLQTVQEIPSK